MYLSPLRNIKLKLKNTETLLFRTINFTVSNLVVLVSLVGSPSVFSDTLKEEIIAKVSVAYDAKVLTSLKSITLVDYRKNVFSKQSSPLAAPELWRFNEELTIDFENKKKALVSWRVNNTNKDLEKYIVNEETGRIYDILHGKFSDDSWYNFANTGGAIERSSDTLIAKKLLLANSNFTIVNEVQYQGQPHYQVAFVLSGATESNIYINKLSGVINKVSRMHPTLGELSYVFSNHSKVGNITFARDMDFLVGDSPRTISTFRNIELKPDLEKKFSVPQGGTSWGKPFESSHMLYNKLGSNVYHVGKNSSRTLFIDAGEYFISVGGNGAIKENFASLQNYLHIKKPLKFAVLTHHHRRQLNMLKPALELNAKIVTVESNLVAIKSKLGEALDENNFVLINQFKEFLGGNLQVFDIATAHADHNLVVYLEKEKILFAEEHYEMLFKKGNPRAFKNMLTFYNKIRGLGIDVRRLIDGSSPRVLSINEFQNTVSAYTSPHCPQGYRVCQRG